MALMFLRNLRSAADGGRGPTLHFAPAWRKRFMNNRPSCAPYSVPLHCVHDVYGRIAVGHFDLEEGHRLGDGLGRGPFGKDLLRLSFESNLLRIVVGQHRHRTLDEPSHPPGEPWT